jgi:spore maturation protein CgeB
VAGLDIVFIGLTLSSAWGNGHATTYRSLLKGLHRRGHRLLFLERDQPWYAAHRDQCAPAYCELELYGSFAELRARYAQRVARADAVIVGSYVDDGLQVCDWVLSQAGGVRAFYDIDTPVTLERLTANACEYLGLQHIVAFDLMLSFTGGPTLQYLENQLGARRAEPLYCSVDVDEYVPRRSRKDLALGYMGTYSADRQGGLEELLLEPAR